MATLFTTYAFSALGAPTGRTMPSRLNDVLNVLDWGADPTGQSDSSTAIQTAINYAHSFLISGWPAGFPPHANTVFFPPGTYLIGTSIDTIDQTGQSASGRMIRLVGAGRDATILRGNISNDYIVKTTQNEYLDLKDMTIWNEDTSSGSGAVNFYFFDQGMSVQNCHFIGFNGLAVTAEGFQSSVRDCLFTCSAYDPATNTFPGRRADSVTPGPPVGSIGCACCEGETMNNYAIGFDIGYDIVGGSGYCFDVIGNSSYRCNSGLRTGHNVQLVLYANGANVIAGNIFDRCKWGCQFDIVGNDHIVANIVSSNENLGVCDPAPIANMQFVAGTVTVTTAAAHNIPLGAQTLQLVNVNPSGFIPANTRNGMAVSVNVINGTQFTYSCSDPGAGFVSGQWNYPLEYGFTIFGSSDVFYAANSLSAVVSGASVDTCHRGGSLGTLTYNIFKSMLGPYGWILPGNVGYQNGAFEFTQCGTATGTPLPINFRYLDNLPHYPDNEYNIIDAQTQNNFAGVVTSGSSHHYKVRWDGTNWLRMA